MRKSVVHTFHCSKGTVPDLPNKNYSFCAIKLQPFLSTGKIVAYKLQYKQHNNEISLTNI